MASSRKALGLTVGGTGYGSSRISTALGSAVHVALRAVLIGVCLFSLLSYGGVDRTAVAFAALLIFALLPLVLVACPVPVHIRPVVIAAALLASVLCVWIQLQAMPLGISMMVHPIWNQVRTFVPEVAATITLTPGDATAGTLTIALPFGIFIASLLLFHTERLARGLLQAIAVGGGALSLFSILQFLVQPDMVLFARKPAYVESLTGVFVNRNTAATLFGLLLVIQLGLAWHRIEEITPKRLVFAVLDGVPLRQNGRSAGLYALCLLLTLCALMLTKSRGGVLAAVIGTAVLMALLILFPGAEQRKASATGLLSRLLTAAVGCALLVVVFVPFAQRVLFRGASQNFEGRFCVADGIGSAIVDHLPWGAGLTSFREVFPAYKESGCGIYLIWDRAHSFYAEGLLSLGLMFVPVLVLGLGILVSIYVRGLTRRRRQRHLPAIGLASLALLLVHSAVDFSLQIPGIAAFFALLSASLVTISLLSVKLPRSLPAELPATDANLQTSNHRTGLSPD